MTAIKQWLGLMVVVAVVGGGYLLMQETRHDRAVTVTVTVPSWEISRLLGHDYGGARKFYVSVRVNGKWRTRDEQMQANSWARVYGVNDGDTVRVEARQEINAEMFGLLSTECYIHDENGHLLDETKERKKNVYCQAIV